MKTLVLSMLVSMLALASLSSYAQKDSITARLKISGYIDVYYSYDFGNPTDHNRPGFMYAYNRHNEVSLHLGLIKAAYTNEKVRANVALMTGSYSNANLAAEPGVLKNIYEANIGIKISKTKNLWIDAGIIPSHIGFESAIGKDCWTLTRTILAENSPYFETGAKISYTSANEKWYLSGLLLNGWQRIQRVDGNNTLAFGHQLTYKPNSKITLNSSSFIGNDMPDSTKVRRYFHDFYLHYQANEKLGVIVGFDIGAQVISKGASNYHTWYSSAVIAQYVVNNDLKIAARGEFYNDPNGVIINSSTINGFKTYGYSLNLDYYIIDNLVWRIEARALSSKDKIFTLDQGFSRHNYFATTALAIAF